MDSLVNTYEHRISVNVDGQDHVFMPGPFEAEGDVASQIRKLSGVVTAGSDEGKAWVAEHPEQGPSSEPGLQIARRNDIAGFGAQERAQRSIENRTVVGDDAAPAGPASGVRTAAGDRPLDPALTTTETEADALRGGVDLSGEPDHGEVGPTAETLADSMPGSPAGPAEAAALARAAGGTLTTAQVPTRSGVRRRPEAEGEGDEFDQLKGDDLDAAVQAHNEALAEDSEERIASSAKADEKRDALRAAAA